MFPSPSHPEGTRAQTVSYSTEIRAPFVGLRRSEQESKHLVNVAPNLK
jgi:hypothetical protein